MNKGQKIFQYVFLTIVSLLSVFPLYYMFCGATNKSTDVVAGKLIPGGYVSAGQSGPGKSYVELL